MLISETCEQDEDWRQVRGRGRRLVLPSLPVNIRYR
jgi:hypothetical protein